MGEDIEILNNDVDEGQEGNVDLQDAEDGSGEELNSQTNEKPKQDRDTNEQFKAARLAAEQEMQRAKARQDAFAKKFGYDSFDEMEAYQAQQEAEKQKQAYIDQGINPDAISQLVNNIVENHPVVKSAKQQQLDSKINADFEDLKRQFPESGLKELKDLAALPTYDAIIGKIQSGYSLADAYESVNRAELRAKQQAAAKQKTLNNINSKQHLNTEGDGEGETNDVHIPAETMQMYLDMGMDKKAAMKYHKKLYG
ncbi:MAG: hypothetical protein Q8873_00565 [Bacillota bacterium]|nr:hypothetical protein [Bacillota bacterium]